MQLDTDFFNTYIRGNFAFAREIMKNGIIPNTIRYADNTVLLRGTILQIIQNDCTDQKQ